MHVNLPPFFSRSQFRTQRVDKANKEIYNTKRKPSHDYSTSTDCSNSLILHSSKPSRFFFTPSNVSLFVPVWIVLPNPPLSSVSFTPCPENTHWL